MLEVVEVPGLDEVLSDMRRLDFLARGAVPSTMMTGGGPCSTCMWGWQMLQVAWTPLLASFTKLLGLVPTTAGDTINGVCLERGESSSEYSYGSGILWATPAFEATKTSTEVVGSPVCVLL